MIHPFWSVIPDEFPGTFSEKHRTSFCWGIFESQFQPPQHHPELILLAWMLIPCWCSNLMTVLLNGTWLKHNGKHWQLLTAALLQPTGRNTQWSKALKQAVQTTANEMIDSRWYNDEWIQIQPQMFTISGSTDAAVTAAQSCSQTVCENREWIRSRMLQMKVNESPKSSDT